MQVGSLNGPGFWAQIAHNVAVDLGLRPEEAAPVGVSEEQKRLLHAVPRTMPFGKM